MLIKPEDTKNSECLGKYSCYPSENVNNLGTGNRHIKGYISRVLLGWLNTFKIKRSYGS